MFAGIEPAKKQSNNRNDTILQKKKYFQDKKDVTAP